MAHGILLLPPSESSRSEPAPVMQNSQGLLHTLLELGETFLSSEIGEDDLQDLETKISAARGRDYDTIRDLQKKIEELSGMSAMVSRLKNELREEKEKAKEEAEDLTQEMAELRYQLMERVEQERELRARTEEASIKRISELEQQVEQERRFRMRLELSLRGMSDLKEQVEQERRLRLSAEEASKRLTELEDQVEKERELRTGLEEASLRRIAELEEEVMWLQARLEEAEGELQAENEQHVEALIQYEEERVLMEADLQAAKRGLNSDHAEADKTIKEMNDLSLQDHVEVHLVLKESLERDQCSDSQREHLDDVENNLLSERKLRVEAENKQKELSSALERTLTQLSVMEREFDIEKKKIEQLEQDLQCNENKILRFSEEEKMMQDNIEMLRQTVLEKEELVSSLTEELFLQKEANRSLMIRSSSLESDLQAVCNQLVISESQANEMGLTIANLQEALLLERMKASQAEEETILQAKRLNRKDEEYSHLKMKYNTLFSKFESLQLNLSECRRREGEACAQVSNLGLELSLAKEEVVKSEVRLQRLMRQKDEQLEAEMFKLDSSLHAQKQANYVLLKQAEQLKNSEAEQNKLQKELEQVSKTCDLLRKERDDLKTAYAELENQFSRRRTAVHGKVTTSLDS